jgi:hypothetical protein
LKPAESRRIQHLVEDARLLGAGHNPLPTLAKTQVIRIVSTKCWMRPIAVPLKLPAGNDPATMFSGQ